ncbi:ATP-binding protein [Actinocatenispora rupis]|uniref:SARP family transcriptional regulator n=1 Tax=Actinocatenispora rupis TaxID=519421 RepID=A0A8J3JGN7_9ACTN|nr:BTAD domain-containing putative transcriptional regulator [Actinocatenispora rupis]GID16047.1 SARP family transcriptional regulator [Actinocatenispora rupis]
MAFALTLLDGVRWRGEPVVGERPQALLAALAAAHCRAVPTDRLIEDVWGDDAPANANKALQVLVSRVRAAYGADAIVREDAGYRLGVPAGEVDALRLADLAQRVRRAVEAGDALPARELAAEITALTRALVSPADADGGALNVVRRTAAVHSAELAGPLGRALSATGDHEAALTWLAEAAARAPSDEAVLASLLRSEAAVRGTAAALDRYERHRTRLREQLGVDPGAALQRVHRDLLALDRPVREGLRYDATPLLGRAEDVRRLRALTRTARVVSIVGAGGLGKTRLAHVIGRDAEQPVVHVVELVGCTDPADLVAEVASALGVRDPVGARRPRSARSDVRARIAQHLASGPSLLILDNCEHLVDPVADLVAFLVATVDDLRVLTTTRAPLAIAPERAYQLGELDRTDAVELFRQRAVAARASVALDAAVVDDIVTRLDGLPLAIELAAAKVRVMSVEDIRRRLADRFALLRGGVRNAPDRHQTLLAVIDWSWNLLDEPERRALRWLSVFGDGVTLDTAESVLGDGALDAVQALVDQSLLVVTETTAGVRYRMLETVREYGRVRLAEAGEDAAAHDARRTWATRYAIAAYDDVFGPRQFAAMDALAAENVNLTDALRHALATTDPAAAVQLLAGLGAYWSVRGDHARVVALIDAVSVAVTGWRPPPELADATRAALTVLLYNAMISVDARTTPIRDLLVELGPDGAAEPRIRAMMTILLACSTTDPARTTARLADLADSPDRLVAAGALQWICHALENDGDPEGSIDAAERALALTRDEDGPWSSAILHAQLSGLHLQLGRHDEAVAHARASLPVLERLGAGDDLLQLRSSVAICALAAGQLDAAADELDRARAVSESDGVLGGAGSLRMCAAELDFARGARAAGLAGYREAVERMRAIRVPAGRALGMSPWIVHAEASALAAYAVHGDAGEGDDLYADCLRRAPEALSGQPLTDFPVAGTLLFGLGAWGLLRDALPAPDAVRLLALAERFRYIRAIPTMSWRNVEPCAERRAPGLIDALRAEYGDRRGPELLGEARDLVERLG